MLFLADESCDACMIRMLEANGHDVIAVAKIDQGATDTTVINLALGQSRILLTEDKDFGQLVYASSHGHNGIILLRYPFPQFQRGHVFTFHIFSELIAQEFINCEM